MLKKKGSKSKAGNYGLVSLTSIECKVMEFLLQGIFMNHVITNNLVSKSNIYIRVASLKEDQQPFVSCMC